MITIREGNNELNARLEKIAVSDLLTFRLQNPGAGGVLWNLIIWDINAKKYVASLEGAVAIDKPQTLPFMTDFLLSWQEQSAGQPVTFGPYLIHVTAPGDFTIDGRGKTLNGILMQSISNKECQFIGTVSNAQGNPMFTVDLTLEAITPDSIYNLYHYQIGIPFRIRLYGATAVGYPYGDATTPIWRVPNGTRVFGYIAPTIDYGLCIGAMMAMSTYDYSLKAQGPTEEGEYRYWYAIDDYQFSGSFTRFNERQLGYGVSGCDVRYVILEASGKQFAWALIWKSHVGYQIEVLQASGVGSVQGVYVGLQTYPQTEGLQLWVNPDPNAEWINYGSSQNRQINEFYGWILIAVSD